MDLPCTLDVKVGFLFYNTNTMAIGIDKPFRIENHVLVVNHDAIRGMEPFNTILRRKRTMVGDADGRRKKFNFSELMYIYFMADYNSYHRALPKKEKHKKCRDDAGLPDHWTPDEVVIKGVRKYREIIDKYIPSARILISLDKGLGMAAIAVDSYSEQMEILLEISSEQIKNVGKDDPEAMDVIMQTNALVRANIKEIMSIGKDLPKTIDGIKSLQVQVRKEEGSAKELAGGKKKNRREDP